MKTESKKKIGVIGCGHWGPNHVRTFFFNPNTEVVRVCDADEKRLSSIKSLYKDIETTTKSEDITRANDIDAVIICTPTKTHYLIAKDALVNGKDVFCEKPLTLKIEESEELIEIAKEKKLILMVGHIFLFNSGILKLKEILKFKDCGETYYIHSHRTNLGPIRNDVNVVYDLASHDIYIFNFLLDAEPKVVSAVGKCILRPNIEDIAFITLEYPQNILVHLHVSWLDPKKIREIIVVGNKKMVTWNDMSDRPIEIYSKHVEKEPYPHDYGEFQLIAKEGEVLIPHVKISEPLRKQADHFIECITERKEPISNGYKGLQVVKTLNEINKKILVDIPA